MFSGDQRKIEMGITSFVFVMSQLFIKKKAVHKAT